MPSIDREERIVSGTAVEGRVLGVCVGRVADLADGARVHRSAFVKRPVTGAVPLGALGLDGDEHHYPDHGGPDQALLVYSKTHYGTWAEEFGLDLPEVGAFGENLTVDGLIETTVCIGDTFEIGETVVQVTSPRSPCYKIGARYGRRALPVRMQETARPGYLLRVLTTGTLEAGMVARLVDRPTSTVTVAAAARVVGRDRDDWPAVDRVAAIPELAPALRALLRARSAARHAGEDRDRLYGD
jgi:MOSC domain-containing protein YiiM